MNDPDQRTAAENLKAKIWQTNNRKPKAQRLSTTYRLRQEDYEKPATQPPNA
jgi:hypothetical protein